MSRRVLIDGREGALNRMQRTKVTLEELAVQDDSKPGEYVLAVIGKVLTSNLAFEKFVFARVTFNNWASYQDYTCVYTEASEDGESDVFAFGFIQRDKRPASIEIALSCVQNGVQYWDNNKGKNYCFYLGEDPLNQPKTTHGAVPAMITTWQVADESLDQRGEEIIFDTSSYPPIEAHLVSPSKVRYYSSSKVATEDNVRPTKAKCAKHVNASNVLAIALLLDEHAECEQIESVVANAEECEVMLTVTDTSEGKEIDDQQSVANCTDLFVEEESVEPIKATKPVDDEAPGEVFDKLEKEKEAATLQIQVMEEPEASAHNNVVDGERNGVEEQSLHNPIDGVAQQISGDQSASSTLKDYEKQRKEVKGDGKKKGKKEKKSHKNKHEVSASNLKAAPETDRTNKDDGSLSSRKEKIENEEPPKKHNKGFLSKFACCGKAEPE